MLLIEVTTMPFAKGLMSLFTLLGLATQIDDPVLMHSVGKEGANSHPDVLLVQTLLNQVPNQVGGPATKLTEDGQCGPLTLEAIERFQRIQLGRATGIIQPSDASLRRLGDYHGFETMPRDGPKIAWGAIVTPMFKQRLLEVAADLELDPNYLMAAIAFETAGTFSPAIENPSSRATGLIQFLPQTANGLGTSLEKLASMTNVEQLDVVASYFRPYRGRCDSLEDLYMAILWPAAIGKEDSYVLFERQQRPQAYQGNQGLDLDQDGKVTKQEATRPVQKRLEIGLEKWSG